MVLLEGDTTLILSQEKKRRSVNHIRNDHYKKKNQDEKKRWMLVARLKNGAQYLKYPTECKLCIVSSILGKHVLLAKADIRTMNSSQDLGKGSWEEGVLNIHFVSPFSPVITDFAVKARWISYAVFEGSSKCTAINAQVLLNCIYKSYSSRL